MDISLHYIDRGSGEPLVLLHGNGESSEYFTRQIDYFSAARRVIAVDTRGTAARPGGQARSPLAALPTILPSSWSRWGSAAPTCSGFPTAANIALLFALRYPDRVRRLVLNGANLSPSGMKPAVWLPIFLDWCRCAAAAAFSSEAARRKEFLALMIKEPHIKPSALQALELPVFVIVGSHDMIRQHHSEKISRFLKRSRLTVLPGSHFIAAENSGAFNDAVAVFLFD